MQDLLDKKYYIWLLPFIAFLVGYQFMKILMRESNVVMPSLIGLSLGPAIEQLSSVKLIPKILAYKEDNSLPTGTIISQSPLPEQKVKPNQSVFLVATKHSAVKVSPNFIGENISIMKEKSAELNIDNKFFGLESEKPEDIIIAQNPHDLIAYYSVGDTPIRIMPNLENQNLQETLDWLKQYNIEAKIHYLDYLNNLDTVDHADYVIAKQKPDSYEFVNIKKPLTVKLVVKLAN